LPDRTWHLLAPVYPPDFGGVSAYTARLAGGLAEAGEAVHVWAPGDSGDDPPGAVGVRVHRVGGVWDRAGFTRLGAGLARFGGPRRLLVQFTPNAWGRRGLNLALGRWLAGRRRLGDDVRVMFHELWYFPEAGNGPARRVLSLIQKAAARRLLSTSSRAYVAIPHWGELLGRSRPLEWLPIPSNISVHDDPDATAVVRAEVGGEGRLILGHFGTFGGRTGRHLAEALPRALAACPGAVGLLIGPGGPEFAEALAGSSPATRGRLAASGPLTEAGVSHHLRACDLLVQPYPGGVSSRRSSVMACLAHGLPVVTTLGGMTEPVWGESAGVALAAEGDAGALAVAVARLAGDPGARARLGRAGRALYQRAFSLGRVVEALTGLAGVGEAPAEAPGVSMAGSP